MKKKKISKSIHVNRCKDISEISKRLHNNLEVEISEYRFFKQTINDKEYIIDALFDNKSKFWYIRMNEIITVDNDDVDLIEREFDLKSPQLEFFTDFFDV